MALLPSFVVGGLLAGGIFAGAVALKPAVQNIGKHAGEDAAAKVVEASANMKDGLKEFKPDPLGIVAKDAKVDSMAQTIAELKSTLDVQRIERAVYRLRVSVNKPNVRCRLILVPKTALPGTNEQVVWDTLDEVNDNIAISSENYGAGIFELVLEANDVSEAPKPFRIDLMILRDSFSLKNDAIYKSTFDTGKDDTPKVRKQIAVIKMGMTEKFDQPK